MAWIKRNLLFVITVAVGLGVTGYCGYLLYSAISANVAASEQYASAKSGLDELLAKKPYPSPDNIKAAEEDAARARIFMAQFKKPFASFPIPPKMDDRQFTEFLQKTVARFGAEATNAGVGMDPTYTFTFSQQVTKLNHPSEYIGPWLQQLEEIDALLHVLYNAKINYLEKVKRPQVGDDDVGGDDYIQFHTNVTAYGVVSPYVVFFRAFSGELANVLAGFASSSNCFIVKAIYVTPSRVPLPQVVPQQEQPPPQAPMRQYLPRPPSLDPFNPFGPSLGRRERDRDPYGQFRQRQMQVQPPPTAAPPVPAGPETILMETPLFVTLYIDIVRLKATEPPPAAREVKPDRPKRGPR